jgi:hypothetical protein
MGGGIGGIGDNIADFIKSLLWLVCILIPLGILGIWKLIELIILVSKHIHIS